MRKGVVYLIGAGPGDPGLITVKGKQLLSEADVVVYDRLTHPDLLLDLKQGVELIYAGKASANHIMTQPEINAVLVEKAEDNKSVARLKGGDPFVFGRGGEEAEACLEAGVEFEVVPGITSAISAPAYAGIPVTHRDAASSFVVITGHERDDAGQAGTRSAGQAEGRRNWSTLAHSADTLIFLMGVEALPEIVARLVENGKSSETPVALVQWGTWLKQKVVTGTLETICEEVLRNGIKPPAVCVVGEVVNLREKLKWFDNLAFHPLYGRKIVVTRAREQASAFASSLRERGAEPVIYPTIQINPVDLEPLGKALTSINDFNWVVFTSVNAVTPFAECLKAAGLDARVFHGLKIGAIGASTAKAVSSELGILADYTPTEAVAESLVLDWPDKDYENIRILLPQALEARETFAHSMEGLGAKVTVIPVYETVYQQNDVDVFIQRIKSQEIDAITFTASSTVHNFVRSLGGNDSIVKDLVQGIPLVSIGPVTSDAIAAHGLTVTATATKHSLDGLMEVVEQLFQ